MTVNDYQALLVNPNYTKANVAREVEERGGYAIKKNEDITTIDLPYAVYVVQDKVVFHLDPDDTTTIHDGTTVLVSNDAKRFKSDGIFKVFSVIDQTNTPPVSPASGDAYLVTSAATGDWTSHEDEIAQYTLNGWKFIVPKTGQIIYVVDETAYYHLNNGGTWVSGLGSLQASDGSLSIAALDFPMGIGVEAEQNAPPGTPVDGTFYIVGGAPTGAWVGHNQEIAHRRSGVWIYLSAYEGAGVYDRAVNDFKKFDGATWILAFVPGAVVTHRESFVAGPTVGTSNEWDENAGERAVNAPTSTEGDELATFTHTSLDTDNVLYFNVASKAEKSGTGGLGFFAAVYLDGATVATDWGWWDVESGASGDGYFSIRLRMPITDTSSHTYRVRAGLYTSSFTAHTATFRDTLIEMEERVVTA